MSTWSAWGEVMTAVRAAELALQDPRDLGRARAAVAASLKELRHRLSNQLPARPTLQALFALAVLFDERAQATTGARPGQWQPLQLELFDTDEGGTRFFEELDHLLVDPAAHPFVLEVYAFCLAEGFRGVYQNDPEPLQRHRARLLDRISRPVPLPSAQTALPTTLRDGPEMIVRVWVVALGAVLLTQLLMRLWPGGGS
ncbi:MAG: hypothetical protein RIT28_2735 [Pseudomonadota bacterium]|jgi:type IV/VI secretion system ImpK/VasF family protein